VSDSRDGDDPDSIIDGTDDAIVADSNAVGVGAGEFDAACGSRVCGQRDDCFGDADLVTALQPLEGFGRGVFDFDGVPAAHL
jgi:hypothetical protein